MLKTISTKGREYHFDPKDLLGGGQFGKAYKGKSITTGETVAIKAIPLSVISQYGPAFQDAVGNEAIIPQMLERERLSEPCPFLVRILDCLKTDNNVYII
jgi:serine/threonine protein kinase